MSSKTSDRWSKIAFFAIIAAGISAISVLMGVINDLQAEEMEFRVFAELGFTVLAGIAFYKARKQRP